MSNPASELMALLSAWRVEPNEAITLGRARATGDENLRPGMTEFWAPTLAGVDALRRVEEGLRVLSARGVKTDFWEHELPTWYMAVFQTDQHWGTSPSHVSGFGMPDESFRLLQSLDVAFDAYGLGRTEIDLEPVIKALGDLEEAVNRATGLPPTIRAEFVGLFARARYLLDNLELFGAPAVIAVANQAAGLSVVASGSLDVDDEGRDELRKAGIGLVAGIAGTYITRGLDALPAAFDSIIRAIGGS